MCPAMNINASGGMPLTPGDGDVAASNIAACRHKSLDETVLVFADVETTGLQLSQGHRICEVALVRRYAGKVEACLEHLVDPERPVGAEAFRVNNISAAMLQGQPHFAAIADEVQAILHGALLVAHNAFFDKRFLGHELRLLGRPWLSNPVLDTLTLAQCLLTPRSSYGLAALARDLKLPAPTHRAMHDVLTLQALFDHLVGVMATRGITTVADVLRCQRGLMPGDPEPDAPPIIAQALREGHLLRIVYSSLSTPKPTERMVKPLELVKRRGKLHLSAYCYLRHDMRSFVIEKIEQMEIAEVA